MTHTAITRGAAVDAHHERWRKALIADKQLCFDEAKQKATAASNQAMKAETLAQVEREHARKMAERANEALKALRAAQG